MDSAKGDVGISGRIGEHIRSNIVGYIALFLFAMGGSAYALDGPLPGQNQVGSDDIINSEVKSADIGAGEVKNGDIGAFEVKANNIAPDSLGGAKIADRSVKNSDLGLGASSSNTIADGGIQGVDVKNNTLTGGQIDEGTLFNDNSLTTADIDESTLSGVPSVPTGPAGGDLGGSYPNPTVAGVWKLGGNSGTGGADFLGTADSQPFNLRVNNAQALRLEPASDGTNESPNVIGGIADNQVTPGAYAATIGGGGRSDPGDPATANKVTDNYGTVGGGAHNQAGDDAGAVDGAQSATVGGGLFNNATAFNATVSGGGFNHATGFASSVGGGQSNFVSGLGATVPGGVGTSALGDVSLAAGQHAQANHQGAFVWADSNNAYFPSTAQDQFSVRSTGGARLVSGIDGGTGDPTSGLELPAGGSGWSTLVNGQPFDIRVNGARGLRIDPASDGTNQSPNVIGGSADNSVTAGVHSATIGGGGRGTPSDPASANRVTDHEGTVGGGHNNQAGNGAGTVGDATLATVGGGGGNVASGEGATVGGGLLNTASWDRATVGGGELNNASGLGATVPGGYSSTAQGNYSLAGGLGAHANHNGAFVWADSSPFFFASTAEDQFNVRSTGGARFVSAVDPSTGAPTAGVQLASGGGSWSSLSDRAAKRAIKPASGREVLRKLASVPVSTWSYRAQDRSIRHIGPMAQDFYKAFGVGEDNKHISSVDADGVALAAIKGLNRKVERLQHKVASLKRGKSR